MVSDELRAGTLEALLPDRVPEAMAINVVFSARRNMPERVRHLPEFLKEWSRSPPEWAVPGRIPTERRGPLKLAAKASTLVGSG